MNFDKGGVYAERQENLPPARFLLNPVLDKQASKEKGHEVYVDRPYVEILKQGGATCQFAVNDEFKRRYPEKWRAFEQGLEEPKTGLPLEKWPGCTRAQCENLKGVNFFTVEDLANASDIGLDAYGMGGREMKKKAIAYLEAARDNGSVTAKLADLEKQMNSVVDKNKELEGIIETQSIELKNLKAKPGRPKKE